MVCNLSGKTLHLSYNLGTPLQFLSFREIFPVVNISRGWRIYLKFHLPHSKKYCHTQDFCWLLKASFISLSVRFASPTRVWCGFRYWSNFVCDSGISEASFGPMSTKNLLKQFYFSLIKCFLTIYNNSSRKAAFSWFCSHNNLLDYIPLFLYIILIFFKTSCIKTFLDFFFRLSKRDLYAL